MNYSKAIFLVRDDVRAVVVSYDVDAHGKGLDLKTFKTLDTTVKVGDLVVVQSTTRHGATVCRVENVDVTIDDFENGPDVKWLMGRVDVEAHQELLAAEAGVIERIRSAEKRRKREELAAKLMADNPDMAEFAKIATPEQDALVAPQ